MREGTGPARRGADVAARLRLVLVTDRTCARRPLGDAVAAACRGGVTCVMLRAPDLDTRALVALGADVARVCRDAAVTFVVNHDLDAALELGADGVHLGYRSADVARARERLGPDRLVGRSTHDAAELDAACRAGADYVTFGPIHDTPSKRGLLAPRGAARLADAVRRAAPVPVVALGGIDVAAVAELRATGAAGVAAIRALLDVDDERAAAAALAAAWDAAPRGAGA